MRAIGIDCGQQPLQKIGAAVYVTHGIYSDTFGERRTRLAAFSKLAGRDISPRQRTRTSRIISSIRRRWEMGGFNAADPITPKLPPPSTYWFGVTVRRQL